MAIAASQTNRVENITQTLLREVVFENLILEQAHLDRRCRQEPFEREQLAFQRQAASISGQRAVRPYHSVTWDNDGYRVLSVGGSNRAARTRTPDEMCDLAVGSRASERNVGDGVPNVFLEGTPAQVERELEHPPAAFEVLLELAPIELVTSLRGVDLGTIVETREPTLELGAGAGGEPERDETGLGRVKVQREIGSFERRVEKH
jgi:hypothetical protein